jgi:hypothetical protein
MSVVPDGEGPSKRKGRALADEVDTVDAAAQSSASPPKQKKARVSRACDQCRQAREKCDAGQPGCFKCATARRACTYNQPAKKRGTRGGYQRALELQLAYLFQTYEGLEQQCITMMKSGYGQTLLSDKNIVAGTRLFQNWKESAAYKELIRLLGDENYTDEDNEAEVAGPSQNPASEYSTTPGHDANLRIFDENWPRPQSTGTVSVDASSPAYSQPASAPHELDHPSKMLRLPTTYSRLLDIYYAYTHSWLPILERTEISSTVAQYATEGLTLEVKDSQSAHHAELWAALAVASFQEQYQWRGASDAPVALPPHLAYNVARSLIPLEDASFGLGHVRALLLLSLIRTGQGSFEAAYILVGQAVRLGLNLGLHQEHDDDARFIEKQYTFAGCFILDTMVSINLGRPKHLGSAQLPPQLRALPRHRDECQPWMPYPDFGSSGNAANSVNRATSQSLSSFNQLYQFFRVLNDSMGRSQGVPIQGGSILDLVKSLDPKFSFCNSAVVGGSAMPLLPSAFLLQATFLASSVILPQDRVSGMWSLMEVAESCISHFDANGTSPLLVALMNLVSNHRCFNSFQDSDRARWMAVVAAMQSVWREPGASVQSPKGKEPASLGPPERLPYQAMPTPQSTTSVAPTMDPAHSANAAQTSYGQTAAMGGEFGVVETENLLRQLQRATYSMHSHGMDGASDLRPAHYPTYFGGSSIDYDALEELTSIDYADGMDADSQQFMANLGFVPGMDLNELLRLDYGAV